MRIENEIPAFSQWIGPALGHWAIAMLVITVTVYLFCGLFSIVRYGPYHGTVAIGRGTVRALVGLVRMSPGRIIALAWLAIQEAIRKKIVVGFGVFILVLMFAGWYLDPSSPDPTKLYLGFVMTVTSYLILLMVLFLSVFSIPNDMKHRTIYTVVTKPVYASEIILGRILGFTAIGTVFLVVMCVLSFLFVQFGLSHTHILTPQDVAEFDESGVTIMRGETRRASGHSHQVVIDEDGNATVLPASKNDTHTHSLEVVSDDDSVASYELGENRGSLLARVPIYGDLTFRDKDGLDATEGINVGDEWLYRSFIQGATESAAIWTFDQFTPDRFPESNPHFEDGIPVEMTIGVFRSHKGDMEKRILGSLKVRNPETGLTVEAAVFQTEEFATKNVTVPYSFSADVASITQRTRVLTDQDVLTNPELAALGQPGQRVDYPAQTDVELLAEIETGEKTFNLFDDLVASDGSVEIWLTCLDSGQYVGAAKADLYVYQANASVPLNFVKGYFGIWQQMVIVIAFGVVFSTFLSGPVAMVSTIGMIIVAGLFRGFLQTIALGEVLGGGPLESFWRMMTQTNLMTEMPDGVTRDFVQVGDWFLEQLLSVITAIVPPLADFNYSEAVSTGFDVSWNWILVHGVTTIGYVIPLFIAGYLILTNREVAK